MGIVRPMGKFASPGSRLLPSHALSTGKSCTHTAATLRKRRRTSLGQHELRRVSLSWIALVREYKAGEIHDTGASSGCELPSGIRQGLRVVFLAALLLPEGDDLVGGKPTSPKSTFPITALTRHWVH